MILMFEPVIVAGLLPSSIPLPLFATAFEKDSLKPNGIFAFDWTAEVAEAPRNSRNRG